MKKGVLIFAMVFCLCFGGAAVVNATLMETCIFGTVTSSSGWDDPALDDWAQDLVVFGSLRWDTSILDAAGNGIVYFGDWEHSEPDHPMYGSGMTKPPGTGFNIFLRGVDLGLHNGEKIGDYDEGDINDWFTSSVYGPDELTVVNGIPTELKLSLFYTPNHLASHTDSLYFRPGNVWGLSRSDGASTARGTFAFVDCKPVPEPCLDLEKRVSGDGGLSFFDANNCSDADVPFTSDDAVYELMVTNCGQEALDLDRIRDDDLQIDLILDPAVTIQPNDSVTFTNEAGQTRGLLQKDGACPNIDSEFDNTATVFGIGADSGHPVEGTDPACVKCDDDGDGIPDDQDECPDTVIPEFVPTENLGTNRFALVDGDTVFDTTAPKGKGPRKAFSIEDTAGCSCEQIIEELGLGKGHFKFGCSISAMEEWMETVNP